MHLEQCSCSVTDGCTIVFYSRAIGRADFDDLTARSTENIGDSKRATDLHQLASRHDDLAAVGNRREGEDQSGGVVVGDQGAFASGRSPQQGGGSAVAIASSSAFEIELEVAVSLEYREDCFRGGGRQRRPSEICVKEDAGGVENAFRARTQTPAQGMSDPRRDGVERAASPIAAGAGEVHRVMIVAFDRAHVWLGPEQLPFRIIP